MADIYDIETGETLTGEAAKQAVLSGRGQIADAPVVVRDSAGNRARLTPEQASDQLASYLSRGYEIESDADTASIEQRLAAQHAPIQAGAEALARGATLGLSDVAARAVSDDYANAAAVRREELGGGVATGLELVGGIVPA